MGLNLPQDESQSVRNERVRVMRTIDKRADELGSSASERMAAHRHAQDLITRREQAKKK